MPIRIEIDLTYPVPENFRAPGEIVIPAGTGLHRFHSYEYGACQFNDSDRGNARFSPIRNAAGQIIPTIYAAESFRCAACEIILRAPDAHPAPGTQTVVSPSDFERYQHSAVRTLGDLRLLSLTAMGQRSIGLVGNALLGGGKLHYPVTRAWAEAIHLHVPWAQGIFYTSYQAGPEFALMLFGDRCVDALEHLGTSRPVRAATVDDEIRTIAEKVGIDYIDL